MKKLYPAAKQRKNGWLKVSDKPKHELYWEEYGNPKGAPVMVLHGGPGGGSSPKYAQFFDPRHYRIIMFDQRGAGKSKPFASLEANTTPHLVADIIKLRDHLGIEGKMHVFCGSWGSTLALAYAIAHPETVKSLALRGIFLCRKKDIDVFYQGDAAEPGNPKLMGTGRFFPDEWKKYVAFIPAKERGDMIAAYNKRLTGKNEKVKLEAATRWGVWEGMTSRLAPNLRGDFSKPEFLLPFARIENHYFINGGFMAPKNSRNQNYILDNVKKIAHIPTEIVHGRYDMVCPRDQADDLCAAWNAVKSGKKPKLHIIDEAGHSCWEPGITAKLVEMTDRFRKLDKKPKP
jgi:proline iminopeptidase